VRATSVRVPTVRIANTSIQRRLACSEHTLATSDGRLSAQGGRLHPSDPATCGGSTEISGLE